MGLELQTFLVFKSLVSLWDAVMYVAVINVCAFLCLQVAALHASFYQAGFSCAIWKNFLIPFQPLAGNTNKMDVKCV